MYHFWLIYAKLYFYNFLSFVKNMNSQCVMYTFYYVNHYLKHH